MRSWRSCSHRTTSWHAAERDRNFEQLALLLKIDQAEFLSQKISIDGARIRRRDLRAFTAVKKSLALQLRIELSTALCQLNDPLSLSIGFKPRHLLGLQDCSNLTLL